jgi:hypothetical protein
MTQSLPIRAKSQAKSKAEIKGGSPGRIRTRDQPVNSRATGSFINQNLRLAHTVYFGMIDAIWQ